MTAKILKSRKAKELKKDRKHKFKKISKKSYRYLTSKKVKSVDDLTKVERILADEDAPTKVLNAKGYLTPVIPNFIKYQSNHITYWINPDTSTRDKSIFKAAINRWNSALKGKVVLTEQGGIKDSDIDLYENKGEDLNSLIPKTDGQMVAGVTIPEHADSLHSSGYNCIKIDKDIVHLTCSTYEQVEVVEHELGHALGLDHSNFSGYSIMHPSADDDLSGLSTADVNQVISLYQ